VDAARTARELWHLFEPVHAVTYFAEESAEAYASAGLEGFWMGYVAGRAAPMGAVGPAVVDATFFSLHPARVARALPEAWSLVSANAASPWPGEPRRALWHGATVLREHRGDGHVAVLLAAGLDGCRALVSMAATGAVPRAVLQAAPGWDDDAWGAAASALVDRGWLHDDGTPTATGTAARLEIEDATDRLAAEPWTRLGDEGIDALRSLLRPLAAAVAAAGVVPVPNPIGLPRPQ